MITLDSGDTIIQLRAAIAAMESGDPKTAQQITSAVTANIASWMLQQRMEVMLITPKRPKIREGATVRFCAGLGYDLEDRFAVIATGGKARDPMGRHVLLRDVTGSEFWADEAELLVVEE